MSTELTRHILMYFILPMWLLAGLADWFCHRRSRIEDTTGVKESLIHLLISLKWGCRCWQPSSCR